MVISTDQINQTKNITKAEEDNKTAIAQELKKIEQLRQLQQQQMNAKAYQSLIFDAKRYENLRGEKGYHSKLQKDPGIKILSNLANDLAKLGIDLTPRSLKKSSNNKLIDELEHVVNNAVLKEDKFEVTKAAVKRAQDRQEEQGGQEKQLDKKADIRKLVNSADVKEALQQYSSAYAQKTLLSSPESKERLDEAQDRLMKKGFSEKDIKVLEKAVKRSLNTEFVSKMQDSFIQQLFSPKNALQLVMASDEFGGVLGKASKEDGLAKEDVKRTQGENSKQLDKKADFKKLVNSSDMKEAAQQYSSAYIQRALAGSPEAKEKLDEVHDNLRQKGFSEKDIKTLEKAVQKSLKPEFIFKTQESFMKEFGGVLEKAVKEGDLTKDDVKRLQGKKDQKEEQIESESKKTDLKKLVNSSDVKEALQKYSSAYIQQALAASPEAKGKLDEAQDTLKQKGFSENDIGALKKAIKKSFNAGFVSKTQTGFVEHMFSPKNASQLSEELGSVFEGDMKENDVRGKDDLTRADVKRTQSKKDENKEQLERTDKKADNKKLANSSELKETVQQYSAVFAQCAVAASPEARERLEDARDNLKKKGFSERDIIGIEKAVKRSFRADYTSEIRDSFIQHMFSPKNTFQSIVTSRNLNNVFEQAIKGEQLSGISNDPQAIREELARTAEVSHEEIQDFVKCAVESRLMERHILNKNNRDEVKKLVELGYKVGFNFDNFLKTWEQKKFDLGLFVMEIENANKAQNVGEISIGEIGASGVGDKHGYEMTKDEEKELLINQLRAEFLKKAITGDPFAVFTFAPKIRKLKNGLIKLGLETEDFNRVEKEAKVLARYRTLEMLKEAFIERATYYELSGPAYGLLKHKMKGLVSNLKNLDMTLKKEELDALRDDTNRQMHDHTIIELRSSVAILENQDNATIEQKVPFMIKLIKRLKEESGFSHGVGEDIDEVVFRHESGQKQVKEHA